MDQQKIIEKAVALSAVDVIQTYQDKVNIEFVQNISSSIISTFATPMVEKQTNMIMDRNQKLVFDGAMSSLIVCL